jgi:hypothetical protein
VVGEEAAMTSELKFGVSDMKNIVKTKQGEKKDGNIMHSMLGP